MLLKLRKIVLEISVAQHHRSGNLLACLGVTVAHADAEDIAKQDYQRRNWWEDRWFSDPYTRNVVPMDVWELSTLPPEVKF